MRIDEDVGQRVTDELSDRQKMYGRILATRWKEHAETMLRRYSGHRTEKMPGNQSSGLESIADEITEPEWDDARQEWQWTVDHPAALIHEVGANEHEIRARRAQVLAFEWPNAPEEIKEKFSHTEGDLVFFKSINHPGVPAIGYVSGGRDRTIQEVERGNTSIDSDEFSLGTGGSGQNDFDFSVGESE